MRTLPTDIDLLGHMNNGRYGSLFDLGRFDLLIRTGIWDVFQKQGWYAVVASETITFRKSLELWQRFTVESRLLGHDDKSAYLMHRAVVDGEVYAEMIVRARFLRRSGRHRAPRGALRGPASAGQPARTRAVGHGVGRGIRSSVHAGARAERLDVTGSDALHRGAPSSPRAPAQGVVTRAGVLLPQDVIARPPGRSD